MTDITEIDTTTLLVLLMGKVRERVETHPVITLAAVASVGYMVGWSLPKAVVRGVGSLAVRAAVMHMVSRLLWKERDPEAADEPEAVTVSARPPGAKPAAERSSTSYAAT